MEVVVRGWEWGGEGQEKRNMLQGGRPLGVKGGDAAAAVASRCEVGCVREWSGWWRGVSAA